MPDTSRILETLLDVDAYKLDHRRQYPPGTEHVYSNLTARGSRITGTDATVFFGLQAFLTGLTERWNEFFALDADGLDDVLGRYEKQVCQLFGVDSFDTTHFQELHDAGHLPLRIRAFREGSLVPLRVPYLTIENTDPRFFWLPGYLETSLTAAIWQPITSATLAWRLRRLLDERAAATGADPGTVTLQGHDFSCRGMAGMASAAASGAGHLLSFEGTDTLPAIRFAERFYGPVTVPVGRSCPATEHSVMCAGGQGHELETFSRLLDTYPSGTLAIVSDTWDLWKVITEYLPKLRDKITARDGKLVIRPDSGDPETILCGKPGPSDGTGLFPPGPPETPEQYGVVRLLDMVFGSTVNAGGFRELDPHIGVVYGDSITYERAEAITGRLQDMGYASTTVTLGIGSFTYQYQTRDTFNMAMKATWVQVDGQGRDIVKDPVTDTSGKKSATGRLAVRSMMSGRPYLIEKATVEQEDDRSLLEDVFIDGDLVRRQVFADVRETLRRCGEIHGKWDAPLTEER